jgi:two-component system, NarL family, invasion response regulator UvrY
VARVKRRAPARPRSRIRVLLADDHDLVRRGLRRILTDALDMTVVAEAADARTVLEHVRTERADVLLLDLSMPGASGLELLESVRRVRPRLPVLVLSVNAEDQYAVRVLAAGGAGYLHKECAPDELLDAVRVVHAGGRYVAGAPLPAADAAATHPGYPVLRFIPVGERRPAAKRVRRNS